MTEEQLKAKSNAILDKLEEGGFDLGDWSIEDAHNNGFIDGYREGFKDCAKARLNVTTISDYPIKDEWHDLEKDPNDLPKDSGIKLCYTRTAKYVCASYDKEYDCWGFVFNNLEHCIPSIVIIAWCEIPTFDKE